MIGELGSPESRRDVVQSSYSWQHAVVLGLAHGGQGRFMGKGGMPDGLGICGKLSDFSELRDAQESSAGAIRRQQGSNTLSRREAAVVGNRLWRGGSLISDGRIMGRGDRVLGNCGRGVKVRPALA